MSARRQGQWLCPILAVCLLASATPLVARPSIEEPQFLKLQFESPVLLFEGEQKKETRDSPNGGDRFDEEVLSLKPSAEITARGSVYHPNFMDFYVRVQEGLDREKVKNDGGSGLDSSGTSLLQSYEANALFLREKPGAFQLSADKTMGRREYDFFSTVTVDSQRYGARGGYNAGPVPFTVAASHLDETVDDSIRPSTLAENTATFDARNVRSRNQVTDLNYTYDRFTRRDGPDFVQNGTENEVRLSDAEVFGRRDQLTLNSSLLYYDLASSAGPSRTLAGQEWLVDKMREDLQGTYRYSFEQRRADGGENDTQRASAGLQHQLYESLTSSAEVHGEDDTIKDSSDTLDSRIYGVSLGEDYTKRLSTWGRLSAGYHVRIDRERHEAAGGAISIIDEPHTLTDGTVTFLNYSSVNIASIRVKDSDGARIYLPNDDYVIIPLGNRVQIQRLLGGVIPNGATVRVDYTAISPAAASYTTVADLASMRLDFLDGLLGLYSRYGRQHYRGDGAPADQEYDDAVVGADSSWRGLRCGAEYESYDSPQTPYDAVRLYEDLLVQPGAGASMDLDLSQTRIRFPDEDRTHDLYRFIARYRQQLVASLALSLEGGREIERGSGYDRRLTTVRSQLDFTMGQLMLALSYDLQDETYLGDSRQRRVLYLKAKRTLW